MSLRRWLQKLPYIGLEFWLALPILGIAFLVGAKPLSDQVLSRSYDTTDELEANTQTRVNFSFDVLVIQVQIYPSQGFTEVEVKTNDYQLKNLEFQFATTEFVELEQAIAQELGLSLEDVRKLARYKVVN